MRALALLVVVGVSGCTLLLDVDSVRRNRDAGPPVDQDAGPDFQKDVCGTMPPLDCVHFALDAGNNSYSLSALAAIDGGFLAVIERNGPHRVELFTGDTNGFSAPLKSWPIPLGRLISLSVSAQGDAWAVAWVQPPVAQYSATTVQCLSGTGLANIPDAPTAVTAPEVEYSSVAVNSAGDVVLAASDNVSNSPLGTMRQGLGHGGCPASLQDTPGSLELYYPQAVSVADGGFWLTGTGVGYGYSVYQLQGASFVEATFLNGIYGFEQNSAATTDGTHLQTAYNLWDSSAQGGDGGYVLSVLSVRTSSPPLAKADVPIFPGVQPRYWTNSACGPGCMMTAMVPDLVQAPNIVVAFTRDTDSAAVLGADSYSIACGRSSTVTGASVAYSLDLIGLLYTDPTHANLYVCRKPTF